MAGIRLAPPKAKDLRGFGLPCGNAQRLVTKQELLENIWRDTTVSDELLRGYIRELRETLGDDAKTPRYIETARRAAIAFCFALNLRRLPRQPVLVPTPHRQPRSQEKPMPSCEWGFSIP